MAGGEVVPVNETSPLLVTKSSDELSSSSSSPSVLVVENNNEAAVTNNETLNALVKVVEGGPTGDDLNDHTAEVFPVAILAEIIGALHLSPRSSPRGEEPTTTQTQTAAYINNNLSCYCVAQFGPQRLHRTRAIPTTDGNPLWTIKQSPLFVVKVAPKDLLHHKALVVTVWGQQRSGSKKSLRAATTTTTSTDFLFLGKVRIPAPTLVQDLCHEQRIEFELVDELGRPMISSDHQHTSSKLALRFRFASRADVQFATIWNTATQKLQNRRIPRTVLQGGCQVLPQEQGDRLGKATLVTELEGWEVSGAHFASATTSNWRLSTINPTKRRQRRGMVRVKPYDPPDPSMAYLTPQDLKAMTLEPSYTWVQAGGGNTTNTTTNNDKCLGRLWVEVLSCHDLPNCDYGTAVMGNQTDAFVCVMYGDSMAQTPIIDDELSPHWLPWVQRAFCFGIQHPSHILYLAVFGYKRGVFNHVPIGRVELNPLHFQRTMKHGGQGNNNNTEYVLEYDLFPASHAFSPYYQTTSSSTATAGRIQIRIRQEIFQPRALLLAALQPTPPIYLNCHKKATWYVAKYTACGEHDNLDAFSIPILLAYIDEITKGFLRRLFYAMDDGVKAVVFWKAPWHSCLCLTLGIIMIEQPQVIPAVLVWGLGSIMLVTMSMKQTNPSPWYQSTSYWQYLKILILDGSASAASCSPTVAATTPSSTTATAKTEINAHEGWDAQCQLHEQYQQRIAQDDLFSKKKGQLQKEIEKLENVSTVQTVEKNGASIMVSVEVLNLLGKIQGMVGRIVQACRTIDHIINWERSDRSFLLTTFFFVAGLVFCFIPWAFLFKWTGRISVVVLLGPQNKILNVYWIKYHADGEGKLRQMFEERMIRARRKQEDASKLKAFRQILFGKFGTAVPGLNWTPRLDRPRPESYAKVIVEQNGSLQHDAPYIPGQKMYGVMIPRPYVHWQTNETESSQIKKRVLSAVAELEREPPEEQSSFASQQQDPTDDCIVEEQGVEVTDVCDVEACFDALSSHDEKGTSNSNSQVGQNLHESLKGDWGVEAVDAYEEEAAFVQNSWRFLSSTEDMLHLSNSDDSSDDDDDGEHKVEEGEFAAAVKDAFNRSQSLTRVQSADDTLRKKVAEETDSNTHDEEEVERSPNTSPAVDNVKTFEAEHGKSMAELGFETTYTENDES